MTILKALMDKNLNLRLSSGSKWLVWDSEMEQWRVYEQKYHQRVKEVLRTDLQDEAVAELIK